MRVVALVLVFVIHALQVPFVVAAPELPLEILESKPISGEELLGVLKKLSPQPVFRASFSQEKSVQGLLRPVKSSGDFLFSRVDGIVWQIEKPFPSRLIISPEGVRREVEGQPDQFFKAESDPAARGVSEVFLGLFGSDASPPSDVFEIRYQKQESNWIIALTPKDSQMKAFLQNIFVSGLDRIERIWILEGDDQTFIQFAKTGSNEQQLSSKEKQFFLSSQ